MNRTRIELRYQQVSQCIEAMKPLPLNTHEAVSVVVACGLRYLDELTLEDLCDLKARVEGGAV